jgi:hypothetical protein
MTTLLVQWHIQKADTAIKELKCSDIWMSQKEKCFSRCFIRPEGD